jgi:hypothetical protein
VSWDISKEKYHVQISVGGGVLNHVGYFTEEVQAARVYDTATVQLYGQEAQLNFPFSKTPSSLRAAMAKKGTNGKSPGVGARTTVSPITGVGADTPGPDPDKNAEPTSSAVAQGGFAGSGGDAWY